MQKLFIAQEEELKSWIREIIREELKIIVTDLHEKGSPKDEPLLTRKEIASYLRISLVTLSDWVKRGLPSHKKRGLMAKKGRVLFLRSEVLEWVKENRA